MKQRKGVSVREGTHTCRQREDDSLKSWMTVRATDGCSADSSSLSLARDVSNKIENEKQRG